MIKTLLIIIPSKISTILNTINISMMTSTIQMKIFPYMINKFSTLLLFTDPKKFFLIFVLTIALFILIKICYPSIMYCFDNTNLSISPSNSSISNISNISKTYGSYGDGTFDSIRYAMDLQRVNVEIVPQVVREVPVVPTVNPVAQTTVSSSSHSFFDLVKSFFCGCFKS
nr:hypothetical protein [Amoeboaphelidium protococcarum]